MTEIAMQRPRAIRISTFLFIGLCLVLVSWRLPAADENLPSDPKFPFHTDFANSHLPWLQLKPSHFPPLHSAHRIIGELVSADFIHRTGEYYSSQTGERLKFTMPPYASIRFLNAEANLRDIPFGTVMAFFLNQDENGHFTRLALMNDQFSSDIAQGFSYRLEELKFSEGKLLTNKHRRSEKATALDLNLSSQTEPAAGAVSLNVTASTRVWKADKPVKLEDLKPGDELLFNLTGKMGQHAGYCSDIWIGTETFQVVSDAQQKKFNDFTKARGLPCWIDKTEKNKITVTLFSGDVRSFNARWMSDFAVGKNVRVCVANDELRTWNPDVDGERASVLEVQNVVTDCYGCSGVRLVIRVDNMLEGFRRGRVVRIFGEGWKVLDPPYGESLMNYGFAVIRNPELVENVAREYPEQFPFRTEFCNSHLAWYQLKDGVAPPRFSEHRVLGELIDIDSKTRKGQVRVDITGEIINFVALSDAKLKYLNVEVKLEELPSGQRYRFDLYQDEKGKFTRCTSIKDEFTHLAENVVTLRIESMDLDHGTITVAHQIPEVKDYNDDVQRPPDIGRSLIRVNEQTRVWNDKVPLQLVDLKPGDALRINLAGELRSKPAMCTDLWIQTGDSLR